MIDINCKITTLKLPQNLSRDDDLVHQNLQMGRILTDFIYHINTSMACCRQCCFNPLGPRQNGCHFTDIFKCFFLNKNVWISIKISLKFVPTDPSNNIPALIQIMAWCWPGNKPLSEPMMVRLLTHICITRPQWVMDHNTCDLIFSVQDMEIKF